VERDEASSEGVEVGRTRHSSGEAAVVFEVDAIGEVIDMVVRKKVDEDE